MFVSHFQATRNVTMIDSCVFVLGRYCTDTFTHAAHGHGHTVRDGRGRFINPYFRRTHAYTHTHRESNKHTHMLSLFRTHPMHTCIGISAVVRNTCVQECGLTGKHAHTPYHTRAQLVHWCGWHWLNANNTLARDQRRWTRLSPGV